jgi:hypothetical protein
MTTFFWSQPNAPVEQLQRRVKMQESALAQARSDLHAARQREGLEPLEPAFDASSAPVWSPPGVVADPAELAQRIIAADRKARGLEPVAKPVEGSLAAKIIAAAATARGEK